jgi:opacity protein-like surface antigen
MFGAGDVALGVSFARNLTDRFSIGFTGKYVHQKIWHSTASSVALDIGTLFTTRFNDMTIGMSISNFGNKMRLEGKDTLVRHDNVNAHLDTGKWSLPLIFRVGVAMDAVTLGDSRLTVAADALHPNDNTECMNLGLEYGFKEMFFLRLGYKSLFTRDSEQGLTAGAGVEYGWGESMSLTIDYAYADFGLIQDTQRLSLGVVF